VFTTVAEKVDPRQSGAFAVTTAKEAEKMQLQELERGVSGICDAIERLNHRLDDFQSQIGVLVARIEAQDTAIAILTQDVNEWQLRTEPIEERA
jgi:peptidoglycan hydrolase CwlO-like protein